MQKKKAYPVPKLVYHGAVTELTRQGTAANSDVPEGIANTAYPVNDLS